MVEILAHIKISNNECHFHPHRTVLTVYSHIIADEPLLLPGKQAEGHESYPAQRSTRLSVSSLQKSPHTLQPLILCGRTIVSQAPYRVNKCDSLVAMCR